MNINAILAPSRKGKALNGMGDSPSMNEEGNAGWRDILALGPALFDRLSRSILHAGALLEGKVKQPIDRAARLKYTRTMGYVAVLRSGGFGALATALPIVLLYAGIVPFFPSLNPDGADFTGWNIAAFYAALILASLLATVLELFLLYNDAVRYAGKMNYATSRRVDDEVEVNEAIEAALPEGLTKAALGMVKDRAPKHGIDPLEDGSKAGAAARGVAFKAKVLMINAMMKQIARRIFARLFGRAAPRAFVEWLLLPIYVFWNMVGTTRVMNELIARANGPEAAAEIVRQVGWSGGLPDELQGPAKIAISRHVKAKKAFHPNIEFVLLELGLSEQDHVAPVFDATLLSEPQRQQLAKFILALPHLEVRRIRIDDALWSFVLEAIPEGERRAWRAACKAYIDRGVPFEARAMR